jgi:hypothetical protein
MPPDGNDRSRRGSTITRAPAAPARSAVRSREALSTTMTSLTFCASTVVTTLPIAVSSSRHG